MIQQIGVLTCEKFNKDGFVDWWQSKCECSDLNLLGKVHIIFKSKPQNGPPLDVKIKFLLR